MADVASGSSWMRVWTRAVIAPAARRAAAVWAGAGIVAAVVFGGTGMHPRDLTELAVHVAAVAAVLGATWVLLMLPAARVLVRGDGARYLRSLPGPRAWPVAAAAAALVALQGPWLALWLAGEGARGLVVIAATTLVIAGLARWQVRPARGRQVRWRRAGTALFGVYARALRRRAADALVRGAGLAVLAGIAAGLLVRNNALAGPGAGALGAAVIAIVLAPGWAGALAPLADAHRETGWLAGSLGISDTAREAVLATTVVAVYAAGAAVASAAAAALAAPSAVGWIAVTAVIGAAGGGLVATRAVLVAARGGGAGAVRIAVGAVIASAVVVLAVGLLGAWGAGAAVATGAVVLAARSR